MVYRSVMQEQLEQIERDGYAIFRNFLNTDETARIRAFMDSQLPAPEPRDDLHARRLFEMRHPIEGEIMADIVNNPRLIELATALLEANDLKLLEQVLIRTDPRDATLGPTGASGWHLDMTFMPEHFNARPRQTYYHMVHALNNVAPGGGGTTVVPGSHHKSYAAAAKLGIDRLSELKNDPINVAGIDLAEAVELHPQEGDLLVFNPMCLHSASVNTSSEPRYVYFASFFDASAQFLLDHLNSVNYKRTFPETLRNNLPETLQSLLAA